MGDINPCAVSGTKYTEIALVSTTHKQMWGIPLSYPHIPVLQSVWS